MTGAFKAVHQVKQVAGEMAGKQDSKGRGTAHMETVTRWVMRKHLKKKKNPSGMTRNNPSS